MLALARKHVILDVEAHLQSGATAHVTLRLPDPLAALALKALAYGLTQAAKDAVDVWRLLAVGHAAGIQPEDWGNGLGIRGDAADALCCAFGALASRGLPALGAGHRTPTQFGAHTPPHGALGGRRPNVGPSS